MLIVRYEPINSSHITRDPHGTHDNEAAMTTLDLNTALANLTPGNALREEAFMTISVHLYSATLRTSFGSYRDIDHDDAVQEALHALLRRGRPIVARSAPAYLYTVLANAYKALAGAAARRREEERLHFESERAVQERHVRMTPHETTSKGHAITEYTNGMPNLAAAMFDVNIDAILLDHLCSSIVPLMANCTQPVAIQFATDRVAIVTGQRTLAGILVRELAGALQTPGNLRRARNAFHQRASRYRARFTEVFARQDLANVTGLLDEELVFLMRWACEMGLV
jgi:DNA-directed RNA polymerase specialized sigma24 family protein